MPARELVVLGTASQAPTRHRNHNGYLLRWDAEGLLFDPGEGTQRQLLLAGVASSAITRICITHVHDAGLAAAYGHLTAAQAARLAVEAGARRLVLTHFSQRYPDDADFAAEAGEIFPDVVVVRDLDRVPVPPRAG